jgi:hypothetical protein
MYQTLGFVLGLAVALAVSLTVTTLLELTSLSAFLVGLTSGVVFTFIGGQIGRGYDARRNDY